MIVVVGTACCMLEGRRKESRKESGNRAREKLMEADIQSGRSRERLSKRYSGRQSWRDHTDGGGGRMGNRPL